MPASLTCPGVYIQEVPSGVRTITGVATSITAFVGRASVGPTDEPVMLASFADFERRFGGRQAALHASVFGAHARQFSIIGAQRGVALGDLVHDRAEGGLGGQRARGAGLRRRQGGGHRHAGGGEAPAPALQALTPALARQQGALSTLWRSRERGAANEGEAEQLARTLHPLLRETVQAALGGPARP